MYLNLLYMCDSIMLSVSYYYSSFTQQPQSFWSTADRFTSPSLPGDPANLLGPASSKEEPTVRYSGCRGNREAWLGDAGFRATGMIAVTQVDHRGLIWPTTSSLSMHECLYGLVAGGRRNFGNKHRFPLSSWTAAPRLDAAVCIAKEFMPNKCIQNSNRFSL